MTWWFSCSGSAVRSARLWPLPSLSVWSSWAWQRKTLCLIRWNESLMMTMQNSCSTVCCIYSCIIKVYYSTTDSLSLAFEAQWSSTAGSCSSYLMLSVIHIVASRSCITFTHSSFSSFSFVYPSFSFDVNYFVFRRQQCLFLGTPPVANIQFNSVLFVQHF